MSYGFKHAKADTVCFLLVKRAFHLCWLVGLSAVLSRRKRGERGGTLPVESNIYRGPRTARALRWLRRPMQDCPSEHLLRMTVVP